MPSPPTSKENVKAVADLLKQRFPNLTVREVLDLAYDIIGKIEV